MASVQELRCDLDEGQLKAKAEALAQSVEERRTKKSKWKNEASIARADIKALDDRIAQLTRDYQDRSETRSVACEEVHDQRRGEVRIVRTDTKAVIDSRPMTAEERDSKSADTN